MSVPQYRAAVNLRHEVEDSENTAIEIEEDESMPEEEEEEEEEAEEEEEEEKEEDESMSCQSQEEKEDAEAALKLRILELEKRSLDDQARFTDCEMVKAFRIRLPAIIESCCFDFFVQVYSLFIVLVEIVRLPAKQFSLSKHR